MNINFKAVSLIAFGLLLTGCGNDYSGDKVLPQEAGAIKNVTYGIISKIDYVSIENNKNKAGTAVGAGAGALVGGVVGHMLGGSKGALVGAGLGAAGGGAAGYGVTKNKKYDRVPSYTVHLENGNDIVIVQGGTLFSVGQRVQIVYDTSGRGRIVQA